MAGYDVHVSKDFLPGLLTGQDGMAKLVETVLNQVLETAKGFGLDLSGLFGHVGIGTEEAGPGSGNGAAPPAVRPAGRPKG